MPQAADSQPSSTTSTPYAKGSMAGLVGPAGATPFPRGQPPPLDRLTPMSHMGTPGTYGPRHAGTPYTPQATPAGKPTILFPSVAVEKTPAAAPAAPASAMLALPAPAAPSAPVTFPAPAPVTFHKAAPTFSSSAEQNGVMDEAGDVHAYTPPPTKACAPAKPASAAHAGNTSKRPVDATPAHTFTFGGASHKKDPAAQLAASIAKAAPAKENIPVPTFSFGGNQAGGPKVNWPEARAPPPASVPTSLKDQVHGRPLLLPFLHHALCLHLICLLA